MFNRNKIIRETRGRYTVTKKYTGRKYRLKTSKNNGEYYVVDAIIPTFTPPNGYEAFLVLFSKNGAMRCVHLFKDGYMKWL